MLTADSFPPSRVKLMRYYPIFVDLRGQRCVVVGGGRVAERKVKGLLRAGAEVHLVSPTLTPRLALLAAKKKVGLAPRPYKKGDLDGARLVFAATNDLRTQQAVREDAEAAGVLVNAAHDHESLSGFLVPASFSQGDLQVAISTSGASPALARRLRRQVQVALGREYRSYLRFLRGARKYILKSVPSADERAELFRQLSGGVVADWFRTGRPRKAAGDVKKLLGKLVGRRSTGD